MRIWLNPDRVDSVGLTASEVVQALRGQNIQVAAGVMNQAPADNPLAFEIGVQTQGRLINPEEFGNVVLKADTAGRVVRLRDVARIELGAQSYATKGYLGDKPAIALPIFQTPGTNAIKTAKEIQTTMATLAQEFPPGLEYEIAYNPTEFVENSVNAVLVTILEAVALVVLVVVLFLQSWRASIIPILAIPISLVGSFAVIAALDFSLNNLTLFGLVLAIGIVVDDAIVVVENVERNISEGLNPKAAAHRTMDEVGGALVAIALVLSAVFIPAAFVSGISGQFYSQFAVTIATATIISAIVSLTLSPALAGLLLKRHDPGERKSALGRLLDRFFGAFNRGLERFSGRYAAITKTLVRRGALVAAVYAGFIMLTGIQFNAVPNGFIPAQDQGYVIVSMQLPPGAELDRTDQVVADVTEKLLAIDGVENTVGFAGFSGATFTNASNAAAIFPVLEPFDVREGKGLTFDGIVAEMRSTLGQIDEAFVLVIPPPPVRGIGNAGGFRMMVGRSPRSRVSIRWRRRPTT